MKIFFSDKFKPKEGDQVIVHHNVFRRWYDIRGIEKNSSFKPMKKNELFSAGSTLLKIGIIVL